MGSDPLRHTSLSRSSLSRTSGAGNLRRGGSTLAVLSLAAAFVIGLQLGAIPWRYRKQIWQLQGGLVGVVVGYVVGRWSRSQPEP